MFTVPPVEMHLEIIEHLKPQYVDTPVIGTNGCWTKLTSIAKLPPLGPNDAQEVEPWRTAIKARSKDGKETCALWNLRLTCKLMNELCIPVIFHTVNLIEKNPELSLQVPVKYAKNVRVLRVLVDPFVKEVLAISLMTMQKDYEAEVVKLLQASENLASVAIYFRNSSTRIEDTIYEIIQHMRIERLQSLGIYSVLVLHQDVGEWAWNNMAQAPAVELLQSFAIHPWATKSLKALDIATTTMTRDSYNAIQTRFSSLKSLSIRRGLRFHLGRLWDSGWSHLWRPKEHLTQLHLIDCPAAYAPHIPKLVQLFSSLKHLSVSTCGSWEDIVPSPRKPGWSMDPTAICANRLLEVIHIEHMAPWEIMALGVIPTRKLILSCIKRGEFLEAIERDEELFQCLKTLSLVRTIPALTEEESQHGYQEQQSLAAIGALELWVSKRGVKVDFEGYTLKDGGETYGFV